MIDPMRSLDVPLAARICACAVLASACAEYHLASDGGMDAGLETPDAWMSMPDAGASDAGPDCTCRTGAYRVYGEGSGYTIDYDLTVRECDGVLGCTLRADSRPCAVSGGAFRVNVDPEGYTQLIFDSTPCDAQWPGRYATHGGGTRVLATRVED